MIDRLNPSVYQSLGHDKFVALSTAFYKRVYADDEDPEFLKQFGGRPIEAAIQNQYEFFIQRMGGPNLYTERKSADKWRGHPALRARHAPFAIDTHNAERWLHHMALALDDVEIPAGELRSAMEEFFRGVGKVKIVPVIVVVFLTAVAQVAYFLRNR